MSPADPDPDRDAALDTVVADYFEVKTTVIVQHAVALLDHDQVHDDQAVDALSDDLLAALERRYGRMDAGWRDATAELVRVEVSRQVAGRRASDRALEAELDGLTGP